VILGISSRYVAAAHVAAVYAITCTLFIENGTHKGCCYKNDRYKKIAIAKNIPATKKYRRGKKIGQKPAILSLRRWTATGACGRAAGA
jgi:hypothetical protein